MSASDLLDGSSGEIEGSWVDIGQQRLRSATQDGADGCKEAEGRGDNRVAWADPRGGHGQPEGVGAACAAHSVWHLESGGRCALKGIHGRAENEALGRANLLDGREYFVANAGKLPGEVKHLNRLKGFRHTSMVNGHFRQRGVLRPSLTSNHALRGSLWRCGLKIAVYARIVYLLASDSMQVVQEFH
jgi:hypothetical protein